jgi:serine/threonine protein kinase
MKLNTILADRYQILERLNDKTSRQTFLARNLQSQDLVIVKILRFDANFKWDDLKLFEREASTLQNLHHPAIPKYLDYFDIDEPNNRGFALVQTYINAPSLETVVKEGRKFSEADVIELADRILTILTYLHQQIPSVIHRDIKPSNILLDNRSGNSIGDIYLVDFGSVQTAARTNDGTMTIVGTAGYMPLEQFSGQTVMASDLYSLGMTIIYLLTGNHPAELVTVNGQIQFTAEISSRLYRWLEKMTQPYLDKRFDSAKLAQIALTSQDGNYGNFDSLKPDYTHVRLERDREKMEIRFIDGFTHTPELQISGVIVLGLFLVPFCYWNLLMILGCLGFCFVFCSLVNFTKFPLKIINIDRHTKEIKTGRVAHESGKIKWDKFLFKISGNNRIVYDPGYVFDKYFDERDKLVKRGEIKVSPKLQIYFGAECQSIENLSQAELWWLGQELSDFLDLELQVIHPMPKLPAESTH